MMNLDCPIPNSDYPHVLLAHGGGGRLMHQLIRKIFGAAFDNPELEIEHDGAIIQPLPGRLALTTDSYVVQPLFFPGGDIGSLAVYGTVNDLAMCGARPLYLSAGFILEEGLEMQTLWEVAKSMRQAADDANVRIITGDTKVVDRGKGDGIFINTTGIGVLEHDLAIGPSIIRPGDAIIINGDIGRHGMAVMLERDEFSFETKISSDCAPLAKSVLKLMESGVEIHCMRDLTRGGLATVLVELAQSSMLQFKIDENMIPIRDGVLAVCELLGFDPLYVANEGKFVAFVPEKAAEKAISILRSELSWPEATIIGRVSDHCSGLVALKNRYGTERIIEMLSGEQLPRIC